MKMLFMQVVQRIENLPAYPSATVALEVVHAG
jgi:hypothetical protein